MLGANLSDQIPGGPNLTLTLTLHSNYRRESSGGMEWLGVWNCIFSGSEFSNFGA